MNVRGLAADDPGRSFVLQQVPSGNSDIVPPDTFVIAPDRTLLGRLPYDAYPTETVSQLKEILRAHPDLAPDGDIEQLGTPAARDAAEAELLAIEARYESTVPPRPIRSAPEEWAFERGRQEAGEPAELPRTPPRPDAVKAALVPELQKWIAEHADSHPEMAALARVLLGGARWHAGDFEGARADWRTVLELHPESPLCHRARYNLNERDAFPAMPHPDLADLPAPQISRVRVTVPDETRRQRNLELVQGGDYVDVRPGLPFVRIPAGTFTMGGSPAVQERELPTRRVTISRGFLMAAWPVTRELFQLFREEYQPDEIEGLAGQLPAIGVSWTVAQQFCEFLSNRDGKRYRLPTEAEWEYAARGGLEGKRYPWGDEEPDRTRCSYDNPHPVPVASYAPNGYGLFDMVGNNSEWTADYYVQNAYALTPPEVVDPAGPTYEQLVAAYPVGESLRVARGGGFLGYEMCSINCHNSWRVGWPQAFNIGAIGVRLVVDE